MNDTTNQTNSRRSPNGGPNNSAPRHAGVTREWPTVAYTPRRARPEPDEATVPVPLDPAHPNTNSPHKWTVGNVRPSPQPRPPVPAADPPPPPVRPDWRDRLTTLPPRTRIAFGVVLVAVLVVAAVLIGAVS